MVALGGIVTRNVPAPVPALMFTDVNAHATYITSCLIVKVLSVVIRACLKYDACSVLLKPTQL